MLDEDFDSPNAVDGNIRIIDTSRVDLFPNPLPTVGLIASEVSLLVKGQIPERLKPQKISLNDYLDRQLAFEEYVQENQNPRGDVATFFCTEEVVDESNDEPFLLPLIESHNPDHRIVTIRGEEPTSLTSKYGLTIMACPYHLEVDSPTRKGTKILVLTDEPSLAFEIHTYFVASFDRSRMMSECLWALLHQSPYHTLLFTIDRGIPRR